MLRVEKIFEEQGIQDELDAYNPLIPDGSNWKATMLIEYADVDERQRGARAAEGHRGPRLGAGRGLRARSTRSPTRTSSARTTRRPRRCISCASSSRRAMVAALKYGVALRSASTTRRSTATVDAVARRDARVAGARPRPEASQPSQPVDSGRRVASPRSFLGDSGPASATNPSATAVRRDAALRSSDCATISRAPSRANHATTAAAPSRA